MVAFTLKLLKALIIRENAKRKRETLLKGASLHLGTKRACPITTKKKLICRFRRPRSMIETASLSSCEISCTDAMELLCWEGKEFANTSGRSGVDTSAADITASSAWVCFQSDFLYFRTAPMMKIFFVKWA